MEDQLGALGLVLNCITLWNTVYLDLALTELRTSGHSVNDDHIAHLPPTSSTTSTCTATTTSGSPTTSNTADPYAPPPATNPPTQP